MLHRHLIASISKATFVMSGSSLNLQLFFATMLSTTFLLHARHVGVLPSAATDDATHFDVAAILF